MGHVGGQDLPALPQCCGCHACSQVLLGLLQMVKTSFSRIHSRKRNGGGEGSTTLSADLNLSKHISGFWIVFFWGAL